MWQSTTSKSDSNTPDEAADIKPTEPITCNPIHEVCRWQPSFSFLFRLLVNLTAALKHGLWERHLIIKLGHIFGNAINVCADQFEPLRREFSRNPLPLQRPQDASDRHIWPRATSTMQILTDAQLRPPTQLCVIHERRTRNAVKFQVELFCSARHGRDYSISEDQAD